MKDFTAPAGGGGTLRLLRPQNFDSKQIKLCHIYYALRMHCCTHGLAIIFVLPLCPVSEEIFELITIDFLGATPPIEVN